MGQPNGLHVDANLSVPLPNTLGGPAASIHPPCLSWWTLARALQQPSKIAYAQTGGTGLTAACARLLSPLPGRHRRSRPPALFCRAACSGCSAPLCQFPSTCRRAEPFWKQGPLGRLEESARARKPERERHTCKTRKVVKGCIGSLKISMARQLGFLWGLELMHQYTAAHMPGTKNSGNGMLLRHMTSRVVKSLNSAGHTLLSRAAQTDVPQSKAACGCPSQS